MNKKRRPRCTVGAYCGNSCISKKRKCRVKLTDTQKAEIKSIVKAYQAKRKLKSEIKPPTKLKDKPPVKTESKPPVKSKTKNPNVVAGLPLLSENTKNKFVKPENLLGEGYYGATYRIGGEVVKVIHLGGNFSPREVEIAQIAGQLGVGPKVLAASPKAMKMEYLEGKVEARASEYATWHLRSLIGAVLKLHSQNIIHGDLHSSNILLQDNRVKILDYGIARQLTNSYIASTFKNSDETKYPELIIRHKIKELNLIVDSPDFPDKFRKGYPVENKLYKQISSLTPSNYDKWLKEASKVFEY